MKKRFICFVLSVLFSVSLFAQVSAKPEDKFYKDALRWEIMGLVKRLPNTRPYPLQVVESVLLSVMDCDNELEAEKAKIYYENIFEGRPLHASAYVTDSFCLKNNSLEHQYIIAPMFDVNYKPLDFLTLSFSAVPYATNKNDEQGVNAKYFQPEFDVKSDNLSAGKLFVMQNYNSMAAFGTDKLFFQAGLSRNSFGNFYDNSVVLNLTSPQKPYFNVTINEEKWIFELTSMMLSATDSLGNGLYPGKYLFFHDFTYNLFNFIDLSYYEMCTVGGRFDFVYLMPVVPYMANEMLLGTGDDNLLMGIQAGVRLFDRARLNFNVFVDDMNFNSVVKFDFDTTMKLAGQVGVQYVPQIVKFAKLINFDYTLVAPYMYTHIDTAVTNPNYQMFSTMGKCIGSNLEPNSDQFRLSVDLEPVSDLNLKVFAGFARHANVNENFTYDEVKKYFDSKQACPTDGSICDYPGTEDDWYFRSVYTRFKFMNQLTKYYCFQTGLSTTYDWKINDYNKLSFGFDYIFQYERNVGVSTDIYPDARRTDSNTITFDQAYMNDQLNAWRAKLYNQISNYFKVYIKYTL